MCYGLITLTSGAINNDGNLFWGSYAALFVVFVVTVTELCRVIVSGGWPRSRVRRALVVVAIVALMGHAGSGLYYATHAGVDGYPVTADLG